jgi:hypothetical protein
MIHQFCRPFGLVWDRCDGNRPREKRYMQTLLQRRVKESRKRSRSSSLSGPLHPILHHYDHIHDNHEMQYRIPNVKYTSEQVLVQHCFIYSDHIHESMTIIGYLMSNGQ